MLPCCVVSLVWFGDFRVFEVVVDRFGGLLFGLGLMLVIWFWVVFRMFGWFWIFTL